MSSKQAISGDDRLIETFSPLIPLDAPTCYGALGRFSQHERGCNHCVFFDRCAVLTAKNRQTQSEKTDKPVCFGEFDVGKPTRCQGCQVIGMCKDYSYLSKPPTAENLRKLGHGTEADHNGVSRHADRLESDPNGTPQHSPGAKLDAGKTRLWLVFSGFANALEEVGKVGTFGAKKYSDDGWRSVPNGAARYSDALLRHLLTEATGESLDADSGLLHAACAAWNALARLELILAERGKLE